MAKAGVAGGTRPLLGHRHHLDVRVDRIDHIVHQGQVALFGLPVLMEQGDGLPGRINDKLFRQVGLARCESSSSENSNRPHPIMMPRRLPGLTLETSFRHEK